MCEGNNKYDKSHAPRRKVRSAENVECMRQLLKAKQQEHILEKEFMNALNGLKINSKIAQNLLREQTDMDDKRQVILDDLNKKTRGIDEELHSLEEVVFNPECLAKLDVREFKSRLLKLSYKIKHCKSSWHIDTLREEQETLDSYIKKYTSNLYKYSETRSVSAPSCTMKEAKKMWQDYKEVEDFHALVGRTGHTEHWSDEDHLLFLRIRKKSKSIPILVTSLQIKCPDLTAESIVNHEAWYKTYLDLREKHRAKVTDWRNHREARRAKIAKEKEVDVATAESECEEISKIPREGAKVSHIRSKSAGNLEVSECGVNARTIDTKKESIKRWKMEKERMRAMDEEQVRIHLEQKLALEQRRKSIKQKRLRETLDAYKENKLAENARMDALENSKKERSSSVLLKAFREQDEEFTKKRIDSVLRAKSFKQNKTFKSMQRRAEKSRSSSTLFDPTEGWIRKCEPEDPGLKQRGHGLYIKDVPKLRSRWRNEES